MKRGCYSLYIGLLEAVLKVAKGMIGSGGANCLLLSVTVRAFDLFRVWTVGFGVWGLGFGFGVWGLEFGVGILRFGV